MDSLHQHLKEEKESNEAMQNLLQNEIAALTTKAQNLQNTHNDLMKKVSTTRSNLERLFRVFQNAPSTLDFNKASALEQLSGIISDLKIANLSNSSSNNVLYQHDEEEGSYSGSSSEYSRSEESESESESEFDSENNNNDFAARSRSRTQAWISEGRDASETEHDLLLKDVYRIVCTSCLAAANSNSNSNDDEDIDCDIDFFMQYSEFAMIITMSNIPDDNVPIAMVKTIFDKLARSNATNQKKLSKKIQFKDFKNALEELAEMKLGAAEGADGVPPFIRLLTDYIWPARARLLIKRELSKSVSGKHFSFESQWIKPSVVNYLSSQHEPLMKIFKRYKSISATIFVTKTEKDKQLMDVNDFCQFCIDYEIVPQMCSKVGLMGIIHTVCGQKLSLSFSVFEQILGRLSLEIYKDSAKYNTLAGGLEQLFFEIDRGSQIFKHSATTKKLAKNSVRER